MKFGHKFVANFVSVFLKLTTDNLESVREYLDGVTRHVGNCDAEAFLVVTVGPNSDVLVRGGDKQLACSTKNISIYTLHDCIVFLQNFFAKLKAHYGKQTSVMGA